MTLKALADLASSISLIIASAVLTGLALGGCVGPAENRIAQLVHVSEGEALAPQAVGSEGDAEGSPLINNSPDQKGLGALLLAEETEAYPEIAQAVGKFGKPDAVQATFRSSSGSAYYDLAMYYKNPPRSLAFKSPRRRHMVIVADLKEVPRSVQRLAFHELPLPPAWPITIQARDWEAFQVFPAPTPPPHLTDAREYAAYAREEREQYTELRSGPDVRRALIAFHRLESVAVVNSVEWKLFVFDSAEAQGFSEPDGSLYISRGLVQQVNDAQLAGVMAHLMGHVVYGHGRTFKKRANTVEKVAVVAGAALLVAGAIAGGAAPSAPSLSSHPDDISVSGEVSRLREEEREANYAGAEYLARLNLPPDSLFDLLVTLGSAKPQKPNNSSNDFATMHHAILSAADFGRMLDAGLIPPQITTSKAAAK